MPQKVTSIRAARKRSVRTRSAASLQFLVALPNTNPLVWRRIVVPGDYSFWDLHVAIQDAMGWLDYHLHEFTVIDAVHGRVERLGIPDPDDPDRSCTADWKVPIAEYFNLESVGDALPVRYLYDFGDAWEHVVIFEDLRHGRTLRHPRCLAGARACPPEDCGGVHGFGDLLDAIADPSRTDHSEMVEWAGGAYDPEAFDPARVVFDNPHQRWKTAFQK